MTGEQVHCYEGRYEFWDAGAGAAWMLRDPAGSAMMVGEHSYPDVVLEVDHTTVVCLSKLALY